MSIAFQLKCMLEDGVSYDEILSQVEEMEIDLASECSDQLFQYALGCENLTPTQKLVYLALCSALGQTDDAGAYWEGATDLVHLHRQTGLDTSNIVTSIAVLTKKKYIECCFARTSDNVLFACKVFCNNARNARLRQFKTVNIDASIASILEEISL